MLGSALRRILSIEHLDVLDTISTRRLYTWAILTNHIVHFFQIVWFDNFAPFWQFLSFW